MDDDILKENMRRGLQPLPGNPNSSGSFTTDGRSCLSLCEKGGNPDEKKGVPEADTEKMEIKEEKKDKDKEEEETPKKAEPGVDGGSAEATCNITLQAEGFKDLKTGKSERIKCPPGCNN